MNDPTGVEYEDPFATLPEEPLTPPRSRRERALAGEDIGFRLLSEWDLPATGRTTNQYWDDYVRMGFLDPVEGIGQTGQVAQEPPPEAEDPGLLSLMGSGATAGVAGGLESLVGFAEILGFEGEYTNDMQEWLGGVRQTYKPPEHIQESLASNPWLVADLDWLGYNIPMALGSMLPAMGISAAAALAAPAIGGIGAVGAAGRSGVL